MDKQSTTIAFATDHAAAEIRGRVKEYLLNLGYEVLDFGYDGDGSCDYPDYAQKAAKSVASGQAQKGILICGTGMGMAIASNKIKGIIAATVWNEDTARLAVQHNHANILCLGSRTSTLRDICLMIKAFFDAKFEERHSARIAKIKDLEK